MANTDKYVCDLRKTFVYIDIGWYELVIQNVNLYNHYLYVNETLSNYQ